MQQSQILAPEFYKRIPALTTEAQFKLDRSLDVSLRSLGGRCAGGVAEGSSVYEYEDQHLNH